MKFDSITDSLGFVSDAARPTGAAARPRDKGTRSSLGRWLSYLNPFRRTARIEARVAELESIAERSANSVAIALQLIQEGFEAEFDDYRQKASEQIRSVQASADRALASAVELTQAVHAMPLMIQERLFASEQSARSLPEEQEARRLAWIEERAAVAEASSKAFAEQRFQSVLRVAEERANIVEAQLLARMASAFDLVWSRLRERADLASLNDLLKQELLRELEIRSMVAESGAKAYADSGLRALAASIGASNRAMLRIAGRLDEVKSGGLPDHPANEDAINGKLGVK